MWTRKEMKHIRGSRLPYTLGGRLSCIDATDPDQYASLGMLNAMGTLVDAELARRGRTPLLKMEGC